VPHAAVPQLAFRLHVACAGEAPPHIHGVALNCQIRIEPARRRYMPREQDRLSDLFGTPDRWGQTLRAMLWTHVSLIVPAFDGQTTVDLPVPCSLDFDLAATKYFAGLADGAIPLLFLFSGSVFHETDAGVQVAQVPWEKEASFALAHDVWRNMMDSYYPEVSWLSLPRRVFERLDAYRRRRGLSTWEHTVDDLLANQTREAAP
jgi:hypothetical protein